MEIRPTAEPAGCLLNGSKVHECAPPNTRRPAFVDDIHPFVLIFEMHKGHQTLNCNSDCMVAVCCWCVVPDKLDGTNPFAMHHL